MVIVIILFLIGLLLLYKGGDVFVDQAVYFARRFRISELIIGATIVSIGTTLPEVTVSALASAGGASAISYGNAVGSVICNAGLIAGVLLLSMPARVTKSEIAIGALFFFVADIVFALFSIFVGFINILSGICLLIIFSLYILITLHRSHNTINSLTCLPQAESLKNENAPLKHVLLMVLGAVFIFAGSRLLIDNGIRIAQALHLHERIIALSFIALGTSLPELITAIVSIAKGHGAISLGNIIGANFMNLTIVIGISAIIMPISTPIRILQTDLFFLLIPMSILTIPTLIQGKTMRLQGALLLAIYTGYCIMLFGGQYTSVFMPFINMP